MSLSRLILSLHFLEHGSHLERRHINTTCWHNHLTFGLEFGSGGFQLLHFLKLISRWALVPPWRAMSIVSITIMVTSFIPIMSSRRGVSTSTSFPIWLLRYRWWGWTISSLRATGSMSVSIITGMFGYFFSTGPSSFIVWAITAWSRSASVLSALLSLSCTGARWR